VDCSRDAREDDRTARDEAAVVARTVLSTCHDAFCAPAGGGEHPGAGPVGLLAVGARPFLVPSDPSTFVPCGTALTCRVAIPEVGVVLASGTTAPAHAAGEDPGLVRTLDDHRGCIRGEVDPDALQVVPLQLFSLSVVVPGRAAVALTPRELTAARPDWVLARGRRLTEHLEQDHAADLVRLAQAHGVGSAAAVSLERLTTREARLVCLGLDGVTTLELHFDPPVASPAELWRRLTSAATTG
jgi:hypothetical protein